MNATTLWNCWEEATRGNELSLFSMVETIFYSPLREVSEELLLNQISLDEEGWRRMLKGMTQCTFSTVQLLWMFIGSDLQHVLDWWMEYPLALDYLIDICETTFREGYVLWTFWRYFLERVLSEKSLCQVHRGRMKRLFLMFPRSWSASFIMTSIQKGTFEVAFPFLQDCESRERFFLDILTGSLVGRGFQQVNFILKTCYQMKISMECTPRVILELLEISYGYHFSEPYLFVYLCYNLKTLSPIKGIAVSPILQGQVSKMKHERKEVEKLLLKGTPLYSDLFPEIWSYLPCLNWEI